MGAGNVYVAGGFAHSKRATFNVSVATFNTEVLAAQSGSEVVLGSTNATYYDVITVGASGLANTKFTAKGAKGSEISYVYELLEDGTYGKCYTQVDKGEEEPLGVPAQGQFTYDPSAKKITFNETDVASYLPEGTTIVCAYTFTTASNAQRITINSDGIPPVVLVTAYGVAKDACNGQLFNCTLEGMAQVDGNWNFDLAADGEPVVQNLAMEFVKSCKTNRMYDFTVFTEDEDTKKE